MGTYLPNDFPLPWASTEAEMKTIFGSSVKFGPRVLVDSIIDHGIICSRFSRTDAVDTSARTKTPNR
jgi:hypothetical protein